MSIDAIAKVGTDQLDIQQSGVNIDDFLQIFLTQLNFQDPLEPVDNREFIAQLAQFSSLELANQTNQNIEGLLDLSAVNQIVELLGKDVESRGPDGASIIGPVVAVVINPSTGQPELTINTGGEDGYIPGVSPASVSIIRP